MRGLSEKVPMTSFAARLREMPRKRKLAALALVALLLLAGILVLPGGVLAPAPRRADIKDVLGYSSVRKPLTEDAVIIPQAQPLLGIAAAPAACWYDKAATSEAAYGLRPLLVVDENPDDGQYRVLSYLDCQDLLSLGDVGPGVSPSVSYSGGEQSVSVRLAHHLFKDAAGVMVVPTTRQGYELGVAAGPMASYLNIPVILVPKGPDWSALRGQLSDLGPKYAIVVAEDWRAASSGLGIPVVSIAGMKDVNDACAQVVNDRFGNLSYLVVTNPADTIPPFVKGVSENVTSDTIQNTKALIVGKEIDIVGTADKTYDIDVPGGIVQTDIFVNITALTDPIRQVKHLVGVNPVISLEVTDSDGNLLAYAPSMAYMPSRAWTDFLSVNASGKVTLSLSIYYGTKGFGAMVLPGASGYSRIDATYDLTVRHTTLSRPHLPRVPDLSMMAPYLAASHGGMVYADSKMELTSDGYSKYAQGSKTGPAYNPELQAPANSELENHTKDFEAFVDGLGRFKANSGNGTLKESYLSGAAWLALLGDANMVPQYYYDIGSQADYPWGGVGLPGENIWTLNFTLSTGRPIGRSAADASTLVARTLFYERYSTTYAGLLADKYPAYTDWGNNYMFLFGEGGGQTGFIFWQSSFSKEVEQHGFHSEVYGYNFDNDRNKMVAVGAYERANYMEFMLHGNWYWYVPEINGVDEYSTSVKNTDILKWDLGPSIYMTAACLMGRIDGIPAQEAIALNFIHAGLNTFVGSTRSTGSESGTRWMEWDLLYNDTSVGEAVRLTKQVNNAQPTIYVRTLYADPAFNPYEPENGYSDQGRPVLRTR